MRSDKPVTRKALPADGAAIVPSGCAVLMVAVLAANPATLRAESMTLSTIAGDVQIPLVHVDAGGSLLTPAAPSTPTFTAPTIFSAPLPSGSGARALGLSGAFTAIADDATAASWNPAGLIQLERPEFSFVYRLKQEHNRHWSGNSDYRVGDDDYSDYALNYLSAVVPFRLFGHNAVFSFNIQEVYDFTSSFHADFSDSTSSMNRQTKTDTTTDTVTTHYALDNGYINVTEYLTTHKTTVLSQSLSSSTLGTLYYDQVGSVQAITPAFAFEITPKFSLGVAVNIYQEGLLGSDKIRSQTSATYSGTMNSAVDITDERTTTGTYVYDGMLDLESPAQDILFGSDGEVTPYSTTDTSSDYTELHYSGYYDVDDRIDDFFGMNATLGALWTVNEKLTFGACLDLPWTATARQTKTVRSGVTVSDAAKTAVTSSTTSTKDVEFDFPLYWATGVAWHWNNRLTTSFDISETLWSQYSFKAEGESRINPLDGSEYGVNKVDDCWSLRTGTEYLWVLSNTEIPLRVGFAWEQYPAIGTPDQYWSVSLGSGISLGKGPNKLIIDLAYIYTWGSDVMGSLVPGQSDSLGTDVQRHQLYISCIYHF
jgi:long-subunit fatty acid transport protein